MHRASPNPAPPPGVCLVETANGFEVSTSFRHWLFSTYAVLLAVCFAGAGLTLDVLAIDAIRHLAKDAWGGAVLFSLGGLLITYLGLCASVGALIHLCGTFVFRVAGDEAMFTTRLWGRGNGKWARSFRWSEVREFSVEMVDGSPPAEEFALVLRDGTRIVFLDSIRGKNLAFLTQFFRRKVAEVREGCSQAESTS